MQPFVVIVATIFFFVFAAAVELNYDQFDESQHADQVRPDKSQKARQ